MHTTRNSLYDAVVMWHGRLGNGVVLYDIGVITQYSVFYFYYLYNYNNAMYDELSKIKSNNIESTSFKKFYVAIAKVCICLEAFFPKTQ